jgi:hypothetical protein
MCTSHFFLRLLSMILEPSPSVGHFLRVSPSVHDNIFPSPSVRHDRRSSNVLVLGSKSQCFPCPRGPSTIVGYDIRLNFRPFGENPVFGLNK